MSIIGQINSISRGFIPIFVLINFALLIFLIFLNWQHIKKIFLKIDHKTWYILTAIFLTAFLIRIFIPPHQHIMYIDEPSYMEAAKDMLQTGYQGLYPKSIGWPFILSIAFGFLGISNWTAIYTSILLGALSVFTVFFVTFLISQRKDLSLIATLLFSLFPIHIRWSATAETNVASLFFITLTIFFCFLYYRNKAYSLLWLSSVSIAFAAQFRPENYILPVLFLLGCIFYTKKFFRNVNLKFIFPWIILFILSLANLIQIIVLVLSFFPTSIYDWHIYYLLNNSIKYGPEVIKYQPKIVSFLSFFGLFYVLLKKRKEFIFLLFWFCLLWLGYFTLRFGDLGGRERIYMSFYPIIVIFASYGMILFSRLVFSIIKKPWIKIGALLLIVTITLICLKPYVLGASNDFRADSRLLETKIPELAERDIPSDCTIIAVWPIILRSTTNLHVVDMGLFLNNLQGAKKNTE